MQPRKLFISDLHFGHLNMALKRGFQNIEEHDQHIIGQWNATVAKHDTVYILGDITMEKAQHYDKLKVLKGYKKVVLGNHDMSQHVPKLLEYVNSVSGMLKLGQYILTHCPIHESELHRFKGNIHGHVHENTLNDSRYINVSCEAIDYTPIEIQVK